MGKHIVSGKDETVRLFQNPILEYFSHIHPLTPALVYIPLLLVVGWQAADVMAVSTFATSLFAGMVLWTLAEYGIHRIVFHAQPRSPLGKKIHFLVHGIHHAYPRDSTRLVMPPLVSLPLAAGFYVLFQQIFEEFYQPLWIGFIVGYLAYDGIHYAVHHANLTSPVGRYLKRHHMHHHFVCPDRAFGVSNPFWDRIFASLPERAARVSVRRRKLEQFLQRQTSNGTQQKRYPKRRSSSYQ